MMVVSVQTLMLSKMEPCAESIFKVKEKSNKNFQLHNTRLNIWYHKVYIHCLTFLNVMHHTDFPGCYFVNKLVLCREIMCLFQRCLFSLYSYVKKKYFFCTLYYNYYMNIETTSIKLIYHEFKKELWSVTSLFLPHPFC